VTVPNCGECFDPRTLADMARDAEAAGFDGFFLWDHVQFIPTPTVDPWVALAAIALATQRIRIGPLVSHCPVADLSSWHARRCRWITFRQEG
jgi:alkanesulfonate monooxygenase SsuD/methylene tetrahydromethanopterin reductase-like flavin-dependent oxidoreductase (luciferase family)